jgi:hypothetical protein
MEFTLYAFWVGLPLSWQTVGGWPAMKQPQTVTQYLLWVSVFKDFSLSQDQKISERSGVEKTWYIYGDTGIIKEWFCQVWNYHCRATTDTAALGSSMYQFWIREYQDHGYGIHMWLPRPLLLPQHAHTCYTGLGPWRNCDPGTGVVYVSGGQLQGPRHTVVQNDVQQQPKVYFDGFSTWHTIHILYLFLWNVSLVNEGDCFLFHHASWRLS